MKRLLIALSLFLAPSLLCAESYVTPVATARVNDRVYSTTTAFRNEGALDVSCEAIYAVPRDPNGGTLRATYEIPAGKTLVEEDTLMEAGALGTMRIVCSGPVLIAARLRSSTDEGRTFDAGRVFLAAPESNPIASGTARTIRTTSDLVVMETAGKVTAFKIAARKPSGATTGIRNYDLPPFAQQLVNLSKILPAAPELDVEIRVADGGGNVVVSRATTDPVLIAMTERLTPASSPIAPQLLTSSFKAAPFRDPATGLVYMRDRWYDPSTGSFLTPDPEGFADSSNLYAYCGGDPVNCTDPTGRAASMSQSGWILATNNHGGGALRRFSPEEIAKDPPAVRRFLGLRSDITAFEADDIMTRAGYGAWLGNQAGIRAAAIGAETAKPVVDATGTALSVMSGFTGVGGIAQLTQAVVDDGATKTNVAMAGLTVVGLGATDDIVRLADEAGDLATGLTHVASPLTKAEKDVLRTQARSVWQQYTGRRAIWDELEVHHRIPLEWAHAFRGDPNRAANLVGVPYDVHKQITASWNAWRQPLECARRAPQRS